MKMDCTSLSDRDGELFRYTYCFLRLKYGNILENCSEIERSFVICIKLQLNAVLKALDYRKQSPFVLNAYRLVAGANKCYYGFKNKRFP